jgi:hypothetical protein
VRNYINMGDSRQYLALMSPSSKLLINGMSRVEVKKLEEPFKF